MKSSKNKILLVKQTKYAMKVIMYTIYRHNLINSYLHDRHITTEQI